MQHHMNSALLLTDFQNVFFPCFFLKFISNLPLQSYVLKDLNCSNSGLTLAPGKQATKGFP